jgi:hypothetical protein
MTNLKHLFVLLLLVILSSSSSSAAALGVKIAELRDDDDVKDINTRNVEWWRLRHRPIENNTDTKVPPGSDDASTTITDNESSSSTSKPKPNTNTKTSCHHYVSSNGITERLQRLWYRRHRKPRLAYRMAVMASLAYWEFHKWVLPGDINVTGFRLQTDPPPEGRMTMHQVKVSTRTMHHRLQRNKCLMWQGLSKAKSSLVVVLRRANVGLTHSRDGDMTSGTSNNNTMDDLLSASTITSTCHLEEPSPPSSAEKLRDRHGLVFQYWMYNWYESGVGRVKFHDTDLLIATSDDIEENSGRKAYKDNNALLVIAFGGTASAADAVTNIQTFEPANHSRFYHGGDRGSKHDKHKHNTTLQGSLHRGFLNAYSRVEQGSVVRLLCPNNNCTTTHPNRNAKQHRLLDPLHQRFGHCKGESKKKKRKEREKKVKHNEDIINPEPESLSNTTLELDDENDDLTTTTDERETSEHKPDNVKARRSGGCKARGEKLVTILRELVTSALLNGHTVHLTGHSLGGGLASHLALDIVINHPHVPVSRLHLWTFGAPQIVDNVFLNSAIEVTPRLQQFMQANGNGRFHRFVTLSDDCKVDAVSEVAKRTLPSHQTNIRGRAARRLGGVHGHIIHFAEPHYLLTPHQFDGGGPHPYNSSNDTAATKGAATTTRSAVAAHAMINYMQGISRESKDHPLRTDLPDRMAEWLGETKADNATMISA